MKRVPALLLAMPLSAHMVSISTGEIKLEGHRAHYEMRMPFYEVAHVKDPEKTLLASVQFFSGGTEAKQIQSKCRKEEAESALICEADFEFASEVDVLEARSRLPMVTVPNHVHVLRAVMGGKNDQAVLDLSFPKAELRFRPPTAFETAVRETMAGGLRAAGGMAQLLFLAALVIAARSRRELVALTAMFLAGEVITSVLVPGMIWQPAPRFVESAAALTIAYLAVETLLLPQAGQRWLIVGVLGLIHGLYFALFLSGSEYSAAYVLTGVALAEVALIGLFALAFSRIARVLEAMRPVRLASAALLAVGLGWFFLRLRG